MTGFDGLGTGPSDCMFLRCRLALLPSPVGATISESEGCF